MKLYLVPLALAILPSVCRAQFNYLVNPGFEDWNQDENGDYGGSFTGNNLIGDLPCGPVDWEFFTFAAGTVTTARVVPPAGLDDSGYWSVYVTSTSVGDGIGQPTEVLGESGLEDPEPYEMVSGWVYVTQGSVGIALFNQAQQSYTVVASTATTGQWVDLAQVLPSDPSSGFLLLGLTANTDFYADNTLASPTPEPASFAALGLGAFALVRSRRGRKAAARRASR